MKITLLTTDYLPNIGGVAQHIYELARALNGLGETVEIIAPSYSTNPFSLIRPAYKEIDAGLHIWRIPQCLNRSIRFVSGQITGKLSRRRFTRESAVRLHRHPPDILHWHAIDAHGYPAEAFHGPRVWTNHTSNFIEGIKTPQGLAHNRKEAAGAHQIICPSQELADLTVQIGIPQDRVHFIPNGVDTARFHPAVDPEPWRRELHLKDSDLLILCPRRLEKKNGVRFFIQAALRHLHTGHRNCVFAVAGNFIGHRSDSDEEIVRTMISESGFADAFRLLGRVENSRIPGLYAAAEIIVMPSLIEATSLSAMEAMATGKAVVSTNVGGLPFLIRDGENGLLVPPRDPEILADRMRRLLENIPLCKQFGKAGRMRAEKELDWKSIAQQTKLIYERAKSTK